MWTEGCCASTHCFDFSPLTMSPESTEEMKGEEALHEGIGGAVSGEQVRQPSYRISWPLLCGLQDPLINQVLHLSPSAIPFT